MKLGSREAIAVIIALIVVAGFFFIFNRPTSVDIVENQPADNTASFLAGLQQAVADNPTELVVEDLTAGDGEEASAGDRLTVHYVGILPDGTQFDSSVARGEAFTFTLGTGQVISGWDQGLEGMRVGGRRVLIIPPELGYGAAGTANIPPNSTLIFEVLLIGVE